MDRWIEIHWTTGSIDEARRVTRFLVQERLVANAQIIPWMESISMFDNVVDTTQESKVILKTVYTHFEAICEIIQKNSSYEIPEITFLAIEGVNPSYFSWMKENLVL